MFKISFIHHFACSQPRTVYAFKKFKCLFVLFGIMCSLLSGTYRGSPPSFIFLPSLLPSPPSNIPPLHLLGPLCHCCSVDEAVVQDQQSDQTYSSGPETEVPPAVGHVDREHQQGRQEVEAEHTDLQPEGETPPDHHEQKVSSQVFLTWVSELKTSPRYLWLTVNPVSLHEEKYSITVGIWMENLTQL